MKSIFKNFLTITAFSMLTRMLGFFFRIFLSRAIGAEALGIYQVALSIFMVLLTIVSSGLPIIISRKVASYRVNSSKKAMGSLVSSSLIVGLVVSVLLCLIVLLFRNLFSNLFTDENCMHILIILLPSLVFSAVYSVFRGALWGNDNYFGLCVSELLEQVVKIVVCVLMLVAGMTALQGAIAVAWSFTISCAVSAIFVVLLFFFYGGKMNKPSKVYKDVIRQSAPITGVRVASSFTQPLIALFLPARLIKAGYSTSQAMSLYGVAVGMTLPFLYFPSALIGSLATALVPDVSMAYVQNDTKHIEKRVQTSTLFAVFVSFLVVPLFVAIGDKLGVLIYDNAVSGELLQLSAWIMVPMGITNITSAILNSVGMEVKSFINYLCGGVFMFLSIIILPQFMGINALLVGIGGSSLVSAILNVYMLKKKLKIKFGILKDIVKLTIFSIPTIAITSFTSSLLGHVFPLFFDIMISCILGAIVFVALCVCFNVVNFEFYMIQFKEKFLKKAKFRRKINKKHKNIANF